MLYSRWKLCENVKLAGTAASLIHIPGFSYSLLCAQLLTWSKPHLSSVFGCKEHPLNLKVISCSNTNICACMVQRGLIHWEVWTCWALWECLVAWKEFCSLYLYREEKETGHCLLWTLAHLSWHYSYSFMALLMGTEEWQHGNKYVRMEVISCVQRNLALGDLPTVFLVAAIACMT